MALWVELEWSKRAVEIQVEPMGSWSDRGQPLWGPKHLSPRSAILPNVAAVPFPAPSGFERSRNTRGRWCSSCT